MLGYEYLYAQTFGVVPIFIFNYFKWGYDISFSVMQSQFLQITDSHLKNNEIRKMFCFQTICSSK